MIGTTKIVLNQATVEQAIQDYFVQRVFDASMVATVVKVEPKNVGETYKTEWTYEVTVESPAEKEGGE